MQYVLNWIEKVKEQYKVNPYIFGLIYLLCAPFFWYSLYKIVANIKARKTDKVIKWGIIIGIATIAPFSYVAIFGRNLPITFWIAIFLIILFSFISLLRNIRKKL